MPEPKSTVTNPLAFGAPATRQSRAKAQSKFKDSDEEASSSSDSGEDYRPPGSTSKATPTKPVAKPQPSAEARGSSQPIVLFGVEQPAATPKKADPAPAKTGAAKKKPAFMDDSDEDDEEDFKFTRPGTQAAAAKPKPAAAAPTRQTAPAKAPAAKSKPAAAGNKGGKKSLFDSDSDDEY